MVAACLAESNRFLGLSFGVDGIFQGWDSCPFSFQKVIPAITVIVVLTGEHSPCPTPLYFGVGAYSVSLLVALLEVLVLGRAQVQPIGNSAQSFSKL